jgi:hypothetical protein
MLNALNHKDNKLSCFMLLCGNNALIQKTVHLFIAYYVYVLLYSAANQMFHDIKSQLL